MKRRILSLILAAAMVFTLCGCGAVGEIADSVMEAAMNELKNQVTRVLEENKLEVVELKTAFGTLNDQGGKYQFFIAALVRSYSTAVPQTAADTLDKVFTQAGITLQTAQTLANPYLINKGITFDHSDFSGGNYYVIWGYIADLSIDLPDFTRNTEGK